MYCVADIYLIIVWTAFMYTENKKKERRPNMFPLPNPVVKAVFLLYAPPLFWINITVLTLINIAMIDEKILALHDKFVYAGCLLFIAVCVNTFGRTIIFNTCPFIEF